MSMTFKRDIVFGKAADGTGSCELSGFLVGGAGTIAIADSTDLSLGKGLAVSGAATVGGTLGVTGATTCAAITASGAAILQSSLAVTGASTLTGNVTAAGNVDVAGTLSAGDSNKFHVATDGDVDCTDLDATGNLAITGTSTLTGNVTAAGTLAVTGTAAFSDDVTIANSKDLTIAGKAVKSSIDTIEQYAVNNYPLNTQWGQNSDSEAANYNAKLGQHPDTNAEMIRDIAERLGHASAAIDLEGLALSAIQEWVDNVQDPSTLQFSTLAQMVLNVAASRVGRLENAVNFMLNHFEFTPPNAGAGSEPYGWSAQDQDYLLAPTNDAVDWIEDFALPRGHNFGPDGIEGNADDVGEAGGQAASGDAAGSGTAAQADVTSAGQEALAAAEVGE